MHVRSYFVEEMVVRLRKRDSMNSTVSDIIRMEIKRYRVASRAGCSPDNGAVVVDAPSLDGPDLSA
jgi:hypothetical protein